MRRNDASIASATKAEVASPPHVAAGVRFQRSMRLKHATRSSVGALACGAVDASHASQRASACAARSDSSFDRPAFRRAPMSSSCEGVNRCGCRYGMQPPSSRRCISDQESRSASCLECCTWSNPRFGSRDAVAHALVTMTATTPCITTPTRGIQKQQLDALTASSLSPTLRNDRAGAEGVAVRVAAVAATSKTASHLRRMADSSRPISGQPGYGRDDRRVERDGDRGVPRQASREGISIVAVLTECCLIEEECIQRLTGRKSFCRLLEVACCLSDASFGGST